MHPYTAAAAVTFAILGGESHLFGRTLSTAAEEKTRMTMPEQKEQRALGGRDAQPALIGRHYITERDSVPVQYNGIV